MIIKLFYVDLPLDSISNPPVFYSDGQVSSLVESSEL